MVKFIMMIGISGSGKSTLARDLVEAWDTSFGSVCIVSSDAIREELYGDEAEQGNATTVFGLMQARTLAALKSGQSVIYDATNLSAARRVSLLTILRREIPERFQAVCIDVDTPFPECLERNANRNRVVPTKVIRRMHLTKQTPTKDEGWDMILTDSDIT